MDKSIFICILILLSVIIPRVALANDISTNDVVHNILEEKKVNISIDNTDFKFIGISQSGPIFIYSNAQKSFIYGFDTNGNKMFDRSMEGGVFKSSYIDNGDKYWVVYSLEEEHNKYSIYNTKTHNLLSSFESKYWLNSSSNGEYYYGVYHPFEVCAPIIYSMNGEVYGRLHSKYNVWHIEPLDDSTIVFLDGNIFRIIKLPELNIVKEIVLDDFHKGSLFVGAKISGDKNRVFIYSRTDIAVYDIDLSKIYSMHNFDNSWPITNGTITISHDGSTLVFIKYPNREVIYDVYRLVEGGLYQEIESNNRVFSIPPICMPAYGNEIVDNSAIVYFKEYDKKEHEYYSLIFNLNCNNDGTNIDKSIYSGCAFIKNNNPNMITSYNIDISSANNNSVNVKRFEVINEK